MRTSETKGVPIWRITLWGKSKEGKRERRKNFPSFFFSSLVLLVCSDAKSAISK
jgi:hypothetical protein